MRPGAVVRVVLVGLGLLGCDRPRAADERAAPGRPAVLPPPATIELPAPPAIPPAPRGLPPTPSPDHNPTTAAKAELGSLLFFDPRVGGGALACAGCHRPDHGWADPLARSRTAGGQDNLRNTPGLWNAAYASTWYRDGSMPTLEAVILSNWKGQMGVDPEVVAAALAALPGYRAHFERAFEGPPSGPRIAEALAAFVRTLRSGDAPWDRFEAGARDAVGPLEMAGARIFNDRAGCARCHPPPLYDDDGFHARLPPDALDPGRMRVTASADDRGAFATPTLRGAVETAPYFHDGSAPTLAAAIDAELARDAVVLTARERGQLIEFVEALSPTPADLPPPRLP